MRVIPGLTSLQMLTARHAIPLNTLGGPVQITTGRQLRDHGWPDGVATLAVMLDGSCAFADLPPEDVAIWWGAYLGMADGNARCRASGRGRAADRRGAGCGAREAWMDHGYLSSAARGMMGSARWGNPVRKKQALPLVIIRFVFSTFID